ncbi:hypothetical protein H4R33_004193 [Dimargaris cristalligena]|uniref:Uncharacterized protein n=1 Tax=Dimargaris cristalligena TaxID=215637 RepID=A0A4P9ZTN5_9FUNG|nr:hypothetical protein H4R33_004193 [Dimargaris cristalligena]RKP36845.1 hypothetical protein BJ085DRAFT_35637 [Dimargaris cristalligena]|eukprot:RKP36845.1 hypothetical protein BJ085DRAFT_35637 [Dimargaris cristalligena]
MSLNYYLFRQIQNKQVLGSMTPRLEGKLLKQIKDIKLRPAHLRHDLWTPFLVASQNSPEFLSWTHTFFSHPIEKPLPAELLKESRVKRRPFLLDDVTLKVERLCRIYHYLEAKHGRDRMPDVKLYWEQEALQDCIQAKGLEWPDFVSHERLWLRRSRYIQNPELVPPPAPELPMSSRANWAARNTTPVPAPEA